MNDIEGTVLTIQPKLERILILVKRVISANKEAKVNIDNSLKLKALSIQVLRLNKATLSFNFLFDQNTFIFYITDEEIEIMNEDIDDSPELLDYLKTVLENPIYIERYTSYNKLIKMKVEWTGIDERGNKECHDLFLRFSYSLRKLKKESKSYLPWITVN